MKLAVFVLFASNLHLVRTECRRDQADCINGAPGYYRLCGSCTTFFRCDDDRSVMVACPDSHVWDETLNACVLDQTVCNVSSNCGTLPTVDHGVFENQGDQTAVLQCDEGFHVRADFVTPGSITCTDGQWEYVNRTNLCTNN